MEFNAFETLLFLSLRAVGCIKEETPLGYNYTKYASRQLKQNFFLFSQGLLDWGVIYFKTIK